MSKDSSQACILSIGIEFTSGAAPDLNSPRLARRLQLLGIRVEGITQVADDFAAIVAALRSAWERCDLIVVVGGMGITDADLTRHAIAELMGETITFDRELDREIMNRTMERGLSVPPGSLRLSAVIPLATPLLALRGIVPGWWVEREGKVLIALPAGEEELYALWEAEVGPRLSKLLPQASLYGRTLKIADLSEARVSQLASGAISGAEVDYFVFTAEDAVHLCLNAADAETLAQAEAQLRERLGSAIWGADEDTIEGVVGAMLVERGLTLATMESCTGGLLASMITDAPGSSAYFKSGVIAYSNEVKVAWGVDEGLIARHGAVSHQVAQAMAEAVRERLGADIGLGITGVAGPDELEGKPVGTVFIAVAYKGETKVARCLFAPPRALIKRRAATSALFELRRALLEKGG